MKILKYLTIGFLLFLSITLIIGLILPKDYDVSVTQNLKANSPLINRNINDFSKWGRWMPGLTEEQSLKLKKGTKFKGEGANYTWHSNNLGSVNMRIDTLIPNEKMITSIEIDGMNNLVSYWNLIPQGDMTEVTWGIKSHVKIPFNIILYFQQSALKDIFRQGLNNLEKICQEDKKTGITYDGEKVIFDHFDQNHLIGLKKSIAHVEFANFHQQSYQNLIDQLNKHKIKTLGHPMALYFQWDKKNKTTEVATVVPIEKNETLHGLEIISIPKRKALSILVKGPNKNIPKAHQILAESAEDLGIHLIAPVIEKYIKNAENTESPSEYETQIFYLYD